MKVLIIDDEPEKRQVEKELLARYVKETDILEAANKEDGLQIIRKNSDLKLIILDMNFPEDVGKIAMQKEGLKVLDEMERLNILIPVVICSSDPYRIVDHNVIGCVQFSYFMEADFLEIVKTVLN